MPSLPNFSQFMGRNIAGAGMSSGSSGGHTAYGTVPSPISVAPNRFQQTAGVVPGLPNLTGGAAGVVGSELGGGLSPETMNALKAASAEWGVGAGLGPGSGLETNKLFANIAGFSENRQRQGVQDYLSLLTGVGGQQTDPGLATSVAERNANMAAAPDPKLAAEEQLRLFDKYYNRGAGAGGIPYNQTWTGSHAPLSFVTPGAAGGGAGTADALGFMPWNLQSPDYSYTGGPVGALPDRTSSTATGSPAYPGNASGPGFSYTGDQQGLNDLIDAWLAGDVG